MNAPIARLAGTAGLLLILQACSQSQSPTADATPPVDHAAVEAAVRTASEQWARTIAARDPEQIVSYYTADAWQLAVNGPIARDAAERRAFWDTIVKLPVANDTVEVAGRVDVAESGDLAVHYGSFRQIITDKTGALTSVPQKFVTVWRKQTDGGWKVTASMASVEN